MVTSAWPAEAAVGLLGSGALLVGTAYLARARFEVLTGFAPALLRLLRALARDPALPWAARWRLWAALLYNVQPINLIPDVVPVIGLVDNIAVICWALRSSLRRIAPETLARLWTGTPEQLDLLYRAARLGHPAPVVRGRDEVAAVDDGELS
jgi:uncharacterized membrane protein YkvA (DUF1232 family)